MDECDYEIENTMSDIVLSEKERKLWWSVDIACPADNKYCDKDLRKVEKYDRLAWEIK